MHLSMYQSFGAGSRHYISRLKKYSDKRVIFLADIQTFVEIRISAATNKRKNPNNSECVYAFKMFHC